MDKKGKTVLVIASILLPAVGLIFAAVKNNELKKKNEQLLKNNERLETRSRVLEDQVNGYEKRINEILSN